jgi:hypothetical protein
MVKTSPGKYDLHMTSYAVAKESALLNMNGRQMACTEYVIDILQQKYKQTLAKDNI